MIQMRCTSDEENNEEKEKNTIPETCIPLGKTNISILSYVA
jgi:hypothetical protein